MTYRIEGQIQHRILLGHFSHLGSHIVTPLLNISMNKTVFECRDIKTTCPHMNPPHSLVYVQSAPPFKFSIKAYYPHHDTLCYRKRMWAYFRPSKSHNFPDYSMLVVLFEWGIGANILGMKLAERSGYFHYCDVLKVQQTHIYLDGERDSCWLLASLRRCAFGHMDELGLGRGKKKALKLQGGLDRADTQHMHWSHTYRQQWEAGLQKESES